MNGGAGGQTPESTGNSHHLNARDEGATALAARAAARSARNAADAEMLRSDAYLDDVLARLHQVISDLAEVRWSTRGPEVVRAGLRMISSEQARLDAARLGLIAGVDDRDDVVPKAKPKTAGSAFLRTALGLERRKAAREADIARLVAGDHPDLAGIGAAYAGGDISRGHLEVAVGVRRRLGPTCRDQLRPVADPDTGDVTGRRTIEAVDAVLAARARDFTVTELARIGDRLVETLNPPGPDGAHQRRYLTLSQLADGSLQGRFSCGPAQALKLLAVVAALAAPRPGKAIDADCVERDLPDQRSAPQRRINALIEAIDHHPCTAHLLQRFIAQTTGNHSADGGDSDRGDENAAETNDTGDSDLAHAATVNDGDSDGDIDDRAQS